MAAANGALTPPSLPPAPAPASPSLAKRKRPEADAILSNGASTAATPKPVEDSIHSLQSALEAIVTVLKSYDTEPSILTHAITSSIARSSSGEADSKRAKLTPPDGATTIVDLVKDGSYDSLAAFAKDADNASAEILASIGAVEGSSAQPSLQETKLQGRVLAFRKVLGSLVTREEVRREHVYGNKQTADGLTEDVDGKEESLHVKVEEPEPRTVLTLYGTAQGPKQLFSSLQEPQRVAPEGGATSGLDTSVKITLPLRESSLPNIISTTQVYPFPEAGSKKKRRTLGDVFPVPASLPQLSPPKLAKPTTAKGNIITFAPPETPKPSRKSTHSYANQNLSTGYWLGYAGVDMPKDSTSPTAKQKSRQRALSTGEAQQPPAEATLVAIQQAKEDALFRSAYSSFAPTRDDATAIIPEETKNRVWWQKVGEKRFNDLFPIDPALLGEGELADADKGTAAAENDEFKDAVENFTPIEPDALLENSEKSELEKSTEEVLQEISELLETLASHQRIRNSSLATNPRTPVIQNSALASLAGSPSTPSTEEIDIYQMLKSQLTLMIAQLPPYAVAKLNGDQLEELNISRTILIENRDYNGVLEEDHLSRATKIPAIPVPVGTPSLSRMASSGSGTHYAPVGNQYARAPPSIHPPGPRPPSQSYFPQQQSLHRSPSINHYQRSSSGPAPSYQTPTPSYVNNTPRQNFSGAPAYGQQTPRPAYGQTAAGQFYGQRSAQPNSYGGAANPQYYQGTPQAQSHNRYPPGAQNGYYQRPQGVAPMHSYAAAQSPHARTASPLKANPPVTQPSFGAHTGYGTPVSGGALRSTYYGPSQYGTPQGPPTATPGGYSNHQQMMLDRQQAQAAVQSQARLAAQGSFNNRQGSGTPQPAPNGQYSGQQQAQAQPQPQPQQVNGGSPMVA